MSDKKILNRPSGDRKAVVATEKTPEELVAKLGIDTLRERDDLDWYCGAQLVLNGLGPVLIMKHENNPRRLTALYVDSECDPNLAEECLIKFFGLSEADVVWRLSADVG